MSLKKRSELLSFSKVFRSEARKTNQDRRGRRARMESLESRTLLAVAPYLIPTNDAVLPEVYNPITAFGDYDNDGDLDLLLTGNPGNGSGPAATLFKNDGAGNYSADTTAGSIGAVSEGGAVWGDFNRDGLLDFAIVGSSATSWDRWTSVDANSGIARVYTQQGDGTFSSSNLVSNGFVNASIDAGDVDNDGDLDLLVTGHQHGDTNRTSGHTYIFVNETEVGDDPSFTRTDAGTVNALFANAQFGDLNNDGRLDIVLNGGGGGGNRGLRTYLQQDDGSFNEEFSYNPVFQGITHGNFSLDLADYDGDGNLDVAAGLFYGQGVIRVYRGDGTGDFSNYEQFTPPSSGFSYAFNGVLAWGDYSNEGNGRLELLVVADAMAEPVIYGQSGGPTSSFNAINPDSPSDLRLNTSEDRYDFGSVAWGDADGDGTLDFVMAGGERNVSPNDPAPSIVYLNDVRPDSVSNDNASPSAPTDGFSVHTSVDGDNVGTVVLQWGNGDDDHTPDAGLTYDLYLREIDPDTLEETVICLPLADTATGQRIVATPGMIDGTSWRITGLDPTKNYEWQVQAVDGALQGSEFSAVQSFDFEVEYDGKVWNDLNGDGAYQAGEPVYAGVDVSLYQTVTDGDDVLLESATTDANGDYNLVTSLAALHPDGGYLIVEAIPGSHVYSVPSSGQYDLTNEFDGRDQGTRDFGAFDPKSITVKVWEDIDNDGNFETGHGLTGIDVTLDAPVDAYDTVVTVSDPDGVVTFDNLPQGTYTASIDGGAITFDFEVTSDSVTVVDDNLEVLLPQHNYVNVSGAVKDDLNGDGDVSGDPGIDGVTVNLTWAGGSVSATTDGDGLFDFDDSFTLEPGIDYTLTIEKPGQYEYTPSTPQDYAYDGTVSGDSWAAQDFALYVPLMVSGTVFDDTNSDGLIDGDSGWQDVLVELVDGNDTVIASMQTDADGGYAFGELLPGSYEVVVTAPLSDAYFSSDADRDGRFATGALQSGTAQTVDVGVAQYVNFSGVVKEDMNGDGDVTADLGIEGIEVVLSWMDGDTPQSQSVWTDADGEYLFDDSVALEAGLDYTITVMPGDLLPSTDTAFDYTATESNDAFPEAVGLYQGVTVSGRIFHDRNSDGLWDAGDNAWNNYSVDLLKDGVVVDTAQADLTGVYTFSDLAPGNYSVQANDPSFAYFTTDADGRIDAPSFLSSGDSFVSPALADLGAAIYVDIAGSVLEDLDADGQLDDATVPIEGVEVVLREIDGATNPIISTTQTDASGNYAWGSFWQLEAGKTYEVSVQVPTEDGYQLSPGHTSVFTLTDTTSGLNAFDLDVGMYRLSSITGTVFDDADLDGILDGGESGHDGVTVELLQGETLVAGPITTSGGGAYAFDDLVPGEYTVKVTKPDGTYFLAGEDGTASSGVVESYTTATVDMALVLPAEIAATTFEDLLGDGVDAADLEVLGLNVRVDGDIDGDGVADIDYLSSGGASLTVYPGAFTLTLEHTGWSGTSDITVWPTDSATEALAMTPDALTVTTDADGQAGDGELSLREALIAANAAGDADAITFDSAVSTITLTEGELSITSPITITGPGKDLLSIDAGGLSRVMTVDPGAGSVVAIESLTLSGGSTSSDGGAILARSGSLNATDVRMTGNSAASGGAIAATSGAEVVISVSELLANDALLGGAVSASDPTTAVIIDLSTIDSNTALTGGGVYAAAGAGVSIQGSVLSSNTGNQSGGGVAAMGADTAIEISADISGTIASQLVDNVTSGYGGGGFAVDGGAILMTESTISGAGVTGDSAYVGGALAAYRGGMLDLIDVDIAGHSSQTGGAIYVSRDGASAAISGGSINNNQANYGGAVFGQAGASLSITDTMIEDNQASGSGGAVAVTGLGTELMMVGAQLLNNTANSAGGGVYAMSGANVSITSGLISGADLTGPAALLGGGVATRGADLELVDAAIQDLSASYGGGLFVDGAGSATLRGETLISGNDASRLGDGVFASSSATVEADLDTVDILDEVFGTIDDIIE